MNKYIFNCILYLLFFTIANAEVTSSDSIIHSNTTPSRYDFRTHRYRQNWERLIPTHCKVQFAGNMGLLSAGLGWDHGKRGQWETDFMLGYLPKFEGRKDYLTMTVKSSYNPWSIRMSNHLAFEPLSTGLYLNTIIGEEFWRTEPKKYPNRYYGFQTKLRINIFIGERLTIRLKDSSKNDGRAITLFYELSSFDFFIVSAITNKEFKTKDLLSLSFGLKLQLL